MIEIRSQLQLNQISKKDAPFVGGKGASLGEMTNAGFPVPPGFVVTTEVQRLCSNQEIPIEVREEILNAFDLLGAQRVAVRSSAIAEDSSIASWAGLLDSYLNVTRNNLIETIRECWNSIKSERVLVYAADQNLPEDRMGVAVVVQKMVDSEAAGVMFTVNPLNKNIGEIMIEAGFGLGELLVQGMMTPDAFTVDKITFEIKSRNVHSQDRMLVFQNGETREVEVSERKKDQPAISDEQIRRLAGLATKIEEHYRSPQDIEWALEKGNLYILQSRPITTIFSQQRDR